MKKTLVLTLLFTCHAAAWAQEPCLDYEPAVVTLTGVLEERIYPGPPEFHSVAEGDEPVGAWILRLKEPICVKEQSGDLVNVSEAEIASIQLVQISDYFPDLHKRLGALIGSRITVSGVLYHGISAWHSTKVLMIVKKLQSAQIPAQTPLFNPTRKE